MNSTKYTAKHLHCNQANQIIWKICLDDEHEILVWESRTTDKKVSFYAYDFKNDQYLLNDFSFEETWLLSLQKVIDGVIYLSGFEGEHSPVQKGIMAFDLRLKKVIWQNFSIAVQQFVTEGIVVFNPKIFPRQYQLINHQNGQLIKPCSITDIALYKSVQNKIILPFLDDFNADWQSKQKLNYKSLEILSGYDPEGNNFNQYIKINKNGEMIYQDIMNQAIQKMSFDTFFVWQNKLVYIKNKSEVVSYLV